MLNITLRAANRAPQFGFLLLLVCASCWGIGMAVTKETLNHLPSLTLLAIQLSSSSVVLWSAALATGIARQWQPHYLVHGLTGLLEPGAVFVLALIGLSATSATNAALIGAVEPLLLIGLSWLLLREAAARATLRWVGIAIIGTLIVAFGDPNSGQSSFQGDVLILGATLCAALFTIASRYSIMVVPPLLLAALQHTTALGAVIALLPFEAALTVMPISSTTGSAWLMAVATGALQFALPYLLYLYAIRRVTTPQAALFPMIVPIFGMAAAVLLLGEPLTFWHILGGILVIGASIAIQGQSAAPEPAVGSPAYEELDYAEA